MVIVKILGGFASQLEKYIFASKIANAMNKKLVLDVSDYLAGYFRPFVLNYLSLPECDVVDGVNKIEHIKKINNGDELIQAYEKKEKIIYLYKEGQDYVSFIRKYPEFCIDYRWDIFDFVKLKKHSDRIDNFKDKIRDCYSVAVHIRRGDFVKIGWENDSTEFKSIIGYVLLKHPDARFFFFSNDYCWTKKEFGENPRFSYLVTENSQVGDLEDFLCMSLCSQRILSSVSGFGKYADYLNRHNGGKETAITTTLKEVPIGIYDPSSFQDQRMVKRLDQKDLEQGLQNYNKIIEYICPQIKNEIIDSNNVVYSEENKTKGIVVIDGSIYNPWLINDFQYLASCFSRKGYKVLYVRINPLAKKDENVRRATDMDDKDLGYNCLTISDKCPDLGKIKKNINNQAEISVISNIRLISQTNYLFIRNCSIKEIIKGLIFPIRNLKFNNKAITCKNEMEMICRLEKGKKLHDLSEDNKLLKRRNEGIEVFAQKCMDLLNIN